MQGEVNVVDVFCHIRRSLLELTNASSQLVIGINEFADVAAGTEDAEESASRIMHGHELLFIVNIMA